MVYDPVKKRKILKSFLLKTKVYLGRLAHYLKVKGGKCPTLTLYFGRSFIDKEENYNLLCNFNLPVYFLQPLGIY